MKRGGSAQGEALAGLLRELLAETPPRPRWLSGGLRLRYTPPKPGQEPAQHMLSLSRRGVDPSAEELRTVHRILGSVRPEAAVASYNYLLYGNFHVYLIVWREPGVRDGA